MGEAKFLRRRNGVSTTTGEEFESLVAVPLLTDDQLDHRIYDLRPVWRTECSTKYLTGSSTDGVGRISAKSVEQLQQGSLLLAGR
jgi:hypothetical protein